MEPPIGVAGARPATPARTSLVVIRYARVDELPALQDIERAADEPFRAIGMDGVADDDPPTVEDLLVFQQAGRAWASTDRLDRPVGYLLADEVDGTGHIEQVSVHPEHAGQRLGSALIETAARWASELGLAAMTLTTFAAVPWNAPYYARLGFEGRLA